MLGGCWFTTGRIQGMLRSCWFTTLGKDLKLAWRLLVYYLREGPRHAWRLLVYYLRMDSRHAYYLREELKERLEAAGLLT